MSRRKRNRRPASPSPRWGWSYCHDTWSLIKFTAASWGGFIAGFGGLFATSDNASRLIEAKGWYAALGLTVLTIAKWAQLYYKDNTPTESGTNSGTNS